MPLSEYEQRVLEQLERDLGADPKLGRTMARQPRSRGRLVVAVFGIIAGIAVLLVGAVTQIVLLGVAGFAIMALAALWAMLSPVKEAPAPARSDRKSTRLNSSHVKTSYAGFCLKK